MITTHVAQKDSSVSLQGAILLYGRTRKGYSYQQTGQESLQFATVHKIEEIAGAPHIMPGRPMTESDLASINKGLSEKHATQTIAWLDQQMLAKGPDRMIWWTPPGKRPMFFQKSSMCKGTFDGSAVCPVPALIWMMLEGKGLYVYASDSSTRPTPETVLYQAPFFNVWGRGQVCSGNANKPSQENVWVTKEWEKYFFGSHFTHPNFSEKNRLIKGKTPTAFWSNMVKKPVEFFPVNCLVKLPLTAGDLIDPLIADHLNRLPRPQGEF